MKKLSVSIYLIILVGIMMLTVTSCSATSVEKSATVADSFDAIEISTSTVDVNICPSSDGECRVVSKSHEKVSYVAEVVGSVLKISENDERIWLERIIGSSDSSLTVYLPVAEYSSLLIDDTTGDVSINDGFRFGTLDVNLTTGDVTLGKISADALNVKVTTGDVRLSDIVCSGDVSIETTTGDVSASAVNCNSFTVHGTTSALNMSGVIASGNMSINMSTGDVIFDGCDAAEVIIETTTGDIKGSFLTDKIIFTDSTTGDVDVPRLTVGGRCDVKTTTGDIEIEIK